MNKKMFLPKCFIFAGRFDGRLAGAVPRPLILWVVGIPAQQHGDQK